MHFIDFHNHNNIFLYNNILWIINDFDYFKIYKIFILVRIIYFFLISLALISYILDMLLYWHLCPTYFGANNNMYFYIFGAYVIHLSGQDAQIGTIRFLLNSNLISIPKQNTIIFIPHWTWYIKSTQQSSRKLWFCIRSPIFFFGYSIENWKIILRGSSIYYMYEYKIIIEHNIYTSVPILYAIFTRTAF